MGKHTTRPHGVKGLYNKFRLNFHFLMPFRAGILTISDMGSRGEREDTSGAAIRELLSSIHIEIGKYEIVPDEQDVISARLMEWSGEGLDLIVTTG
ncbi:MAG: molybdopterin adenylyltransferase, partial [Anaerolineales bacterium]|nr:molybdopterin adenylyltransferase [Anaerolineales bacterium]